MKPHKPDLNEKLTIRMSVATRREIKALCERADMDEAMLSRMALEAGIQLAKQKGLTALLDERERLLSGFAPDLTPVEIPSPEIFRIKKNGTKYTLSDATGKALKTGPLYEIRPAAKKLCPPEGEVWLHHADGREERVV
jgi:hypothetical protein